MRGTFLLHAFGWWLLAAAPARAAAALTDPTRPAGFTQAGSAPPAHGVVGGVAAVPVPVWPTLQSLQVSAQGGSSALVDGSVVRVGDRLGEMAVVAIDTQGILLRGSRYDQRLALVPGGGKTASTIDPRAASTTPSTAASTVAHTSLYFRHYLPSLPPPITAASACHARRTRQRAVAPSATRRATSGAPASMNSSR